MTIGEKIRHYRMQNRLTQEKLAAELNISFQAVSKWERNETLPDVTVIGRLAELLHVSCDTLLTDNVCFAEREIDEIIEKASALNVEDHEEYLRRAELLEKAMEKYPRSFRVMEALADTYSRGSAYPEFAERKYHTRTLDIMEYIASHTPDMKQRYQAVTVLCYMYRGTENCERIRELAETMPELYQTRPALIHHAMPGAAQNEGIHDYLSQLLDTAECYLELLIYPEMGETERKMFEHLRKTADDRTLWNTARYE